MIAEPATEGLTYCDDGWEKGCGTCANCGELINGSSMWFCRGQRGRDSCRKQWLRNHFWTGSGGAREAAIRRDGRRCVRCGQGPATATGPKGTQLEVNHKAPLGAGSGRIRATAGCHNHLDGLETLCRSCHRTETQRQRDAGELG